MPPMLWQYWRGRLCRGRHKLRGVLIEYDWTEIVLDLRRAGMAQHDIARATQGASGEAAIRSYLAGASPVHWRGEILLTLWMKITGRSRENAPMRVAKPYHGVSDRKTARHNMNRDLPMLARACGVSIDQLMRMIAAGKRTIKSKRKNNQVNLILPGFE